MTPPDRAPAPRTPEDASVQGAEAFARAFPALAARLAGTSEDPSVERLVEGLRVLAGRVERALDASAPRAASHFAHLLFPEVLRPLPSATVLELVPTGPRAGERRFVEAGAEFESKPAPSARARFRAHAPFRIDPWRVEDTRLAYSTERGQSLDVTLASTAPAGTRPAPLFPLRLHLSGEPRVAFSLLAALDQRLDRIEVEAGGGSASLTREALRVWGFRANEPLLPVEPQQHPGVRLLREWLVLPAKFAFVEITAPLEAAGPRLTLRFRFDGSLPTPLNVARDAIRTNCVPVANVFATTTEPLTPSLARPTQVLRPAGYSPEHGDVYAIRQVTATPRRGGRIWIPEAASFRSAPDGGAPGLTYTVRSIPGPGNDSLHVLELEVAPDAPEPPEVHSLSIETWATNRRLCRGLGIGDVSVSTFGSPPECSFRNICAVTPYRAALEGAALRRATLNLLGLSTGSLARVGALRALLHALNLHVAADGQAARAHAQRLRAIQRIEVRPATQPLARAVARGHDIAVHLAERGFDGEGEAFVFGKVLAHLFGHEASLNTFARTTLRLVDTGRTYRFPPLNGDREVR